MGEANVFRSIFFVMTFFTIGVVSNFRKLWEEGIGKLAPSTSSACSASLSGSGCDFLALLPRHRAPHPVTA